MIDFVKRFFGGREEETPDGGAVRHDIRVATAALFLEMAEIDKQFKRDESESIIAMLRSEYDLDDEHAEELARAAHDQLKGSIDLWRFTNLINQNYSKADKLQIVELLWRLVYEDGRLSEHENYLMHKLGKMLRLTHRELIDSKLRVLQDKDDEAENKKG